MLRFFAIIYFISGSTSFAQTTFQKIYSSGADAECFGAFQTNDQGYIITGIADVGAGSYKVFLTRTDCHGNILWSKVYNPSSTVGNISQRVIETHDHGFLLAASIGTYGSYNMLLVRTDADGNALWKKGMQGSHDDLVNSVMETTDHYYIVAGSTSSFGSDAGTAYKDVYLMKVDDNGNFIWGKTYGNPQAYDEAYDVTQAANGYAITGRYIASQTFHAFIMKTDTAGTMQWLKAYGDTNQYTAAYAIANTLDYGFIITGSSTLNKPNFQSMGDAFIIKTDANGDTVWCKSLYGNPDYDDIGSSVVVLPNGGYAIGNATMSYPTSGFVPNKHCVVVVDSTGNLVLAKTFNPGSSHYPYLSNGKSDKTFIISGFSNYFTSHFSPTMIRLDSSFSSGCFDVDVTSLTVEENLPAKVKIPSVIFGSGGSLIATNVESAFAFTDSTLCSHYTDSCTQVITQIVSADEEKDVFLLFPNPAGETIHVGFISSSPGVIHLRLMNELGIEILNRDEGVISGKNIFAIDIHDLDPGNYFLQILEKNLSATKKIVVEN